MDSKASIGSGVFDLNFEKDSSSLAIANRERDFKHGKISHFIYMGLLFGAVFVLTLVGIVQLVLHLNQS